MGARRALSLFGYYCDVPSPAFHLAIVAADAAVYALAGLYLDAVLPGPQGSPAHPLFFLGFAFSTRAAGAPAAPPPDEDVGVAAERAAARAAKGAAAPLAVRIDALRVVYRHGFSAGVHALTGVDLGALCGGCACGRARAAGAGDVVAVSDVSLTVARGEIVALLGHNGAGKTTTISVLTGLVAATGGAAEIAGTDVGARASGGALAIGVRAWRPCAMAPGPRADYSPTPDARPPYFSRRCVRSTTCSSRCSRRAR